MKIYFRFFLIIYLISSASKVWADNQKIKIGVPLALTGDLAQSGVDMRNAVVIANEVLGNDKYELIFEDDRCSNKDALSIARKFIDVDRVKYTLGFTCNQTLISTAPVYERASVFVISAGGTSGDVPFLGKYNFRIFPSDMFGAQRLFDYLRTRHKKLAILTEETEYAIMMDRSFQKFNKKAGSPLALDIYSFNHNDTDFKTLLLKIKNSDVDAIYLNADSDSSFITLLKQLSAIKFSKPRYTVYLGASSSVMQEVPTLVEGVIFSNLPTLDELLSGKGKVLFSSFIKRYGQPLSGFPTVPTTFEAFRVLDLALSKGIPPEQYLRGRKFDDGYLPPYSFDQNGNVIGFNFQMQTVTDGKVKVLETR